MSSNRGRILDKYPTFRACAAKLNISEDNLSNKLKRRSRKFLHQLRAIGINIPELDSNYAIELNNGFVKDEMQQYKSVDAEIKFLKSELEQTKKLLSISVDKILLLEDENKKLSVENAALMKKKSELNKKK
ncbi:MAG: hypothetical protein B6D44_11015 [Ignavibacteriales bacterium UTCHB2]|nr:MAG: hypothetical protein B6D44_11015 [Ignavibacteriales bacterium UTCHB2]